MISSYTKIQKKEINEFFIFFFERKDCKGLVL